MVNHNIYLGSKSPRRKELLELLGLEFKIAHQSGPEEIYPPTLMPEKIPLYLSELKSKTLLPAVNDDNPLLITADTIVTLEGQILGKPKTGEEAVEMLTRLSGKTHEVVTGVTVATREKSITFGDTSMVTFAILEPEEIRKYVDLYHPLDKAGAYGIQEWIGAIGINKIEGSFYNVMGLPVHKLYKVLKNF